MPKHTSFRLWTAVLFSVIGYTFIGYVFKRYETLPLLSAYTGIFLLYLYLVYQKEKLTIRQIIGLGLLFRLVFLPSIPALSDDFYRFIWDGRLWFHGINPFAELPVYYMSNPEQAPEGITPELFGLLNSPTHYTVYPPIPQYANWLAAWIASNSIWASTIVLRSIHILAEAGTLFMLPKVLKGLKIDTKNVVWYALNPLIIIELTGNLHHEALMIFFLVLFMAQWQKGKILWAAFALSMSVAAKLLPLVFLPYVLLKLKGKEKFSFLGVFTLSLLVSFSPLLETSFFEGMKDSLLLYYQKFEFNAGVYYVFRQVGYWIKGYNTIALLGKLFALFTTLLIVAVSFIAYRKKWGVAEVFLWVSTVFALFSLILHPWYIALVILFSSLTNYRFGILWSLLIMATYAGYTSTGFGEVYVLVAIEFIVVIAFAIFEMRRQARLSATLKLAP